MPPRESVWTTSRVLLQLNGASVGIGSQVSFPLDSAYETAMEAAFRAVTVSRIFVDGQLTTNTLALTATQTGIFLGIGVHSELTDSGDFPDLAAHRGDWLMHDARIVQERETGDLPAILIPFNVYNMGGLYKLSSRGQRRVEKRGFALNFVLQKDTLTEFAIDALFQVTVLWKPFE